MLLCRPFWVAAPTKVKGLFVVIEPVAQHIFELGAQGKLDLRSPVVADRHPGRRRRVHGAVFLDGEARLRGAALVHDVVGHLEAAIEAKSAVPTELLRGPGRGHAHNHECQ